MARKLTIRRVGSFLPALSLVVVLLCCVTIGWLSLVGLPPKALRYIEEQLAAQGIYLQLDALKLEPSRGLAVRAEGIRFFPQAGAESPLATAKSFSVGINASRLLAGELHADTVRLREAAIYLPTEQEAGQKLTIDHIDIAARINRSNIVRLTSASLQAEGIPVRIRGSYDLTPLFTPSTTQEEDTGMPDIQALLSEHAPVFDLVYRRITEQKWTESDCPSLELNLHAAGRKPYFSAKLSIPRYDWEQLHFCKATADIIYKDETLTIHSLRFNTVNPDSTASLQAGYSLHDRTLSFTLESNADVLNMVKPFLEPEDAAAFAPFSYPADKAPRIRLSGDMELAQNYAPEHARLRGELKLEELSIGTGRIDQLELSFIYNDGDFNIDKLTLNLPTGTASVTASALKGQGEAEAHANVNLNELLDLVNQLLESPISLPEGLELPGNINLTAQAKLTTLPLNAGKEEWENFVPSCSHLQVNLSTEQVNYKGDALTRPQLSLKASDITQGRNKTPEHLKSADFNFSADELTLNSVSDTPIKLQKPELTLRCEDVALDPQQHHLGVVRLKASLQQAEIGDWKATGIAIPALELADVSPLADARSFFGSAFLDADVESIEHADKPMGKISLRCDVPQAGAGNIKLTLHNEKGNQLRLSAVPNWSSPTQLSVDDIQLNLPLAAFAPVMEHFGITCEEVELPARLAARGNCVWDMEQEKLERANVQLDIPELVRTPHKLVPFKGKRIPIGLKLNTTLHTADDGGIAYEADVHVSHQTGEFTGKATGNTASHVHVTGNNTIRADIIDQLVDNGQAHGIIRDFRFTPRSRNIITNIDTTVRYDNGTTVNSYCDARIEQAEYMLSALEDNPDKTERLRTDLGPNPYTYVKHATCGVVVDVRIDSKDANGKPLKDKICITLTNPKLTYDNEPWLRRQKFKTGTRETTMGGEAVIIDVENSFVELRNISGTVYPAYSIGMFYGDIQHFMADIELRSPAQVETASCVFPIYSDCTRPMSGTIRAMASKDAAFHFLGTSIPLADFSGFIYLTDNYVQLDKLNAKCWGGVLDAVVRIGFSGKRTSFDGYAKASNMNLHHIAAAYGSEQAYALCNGFIRFRSPSPDVNDIQAYGRVDITNGDLLTLSLFRPVSSYVADLPSNLMKLETVATNTGVSEKPNMFTRMMTSVFSAFQKSVNSMGDGVDKVVYYVPGANHLLSYDVQEASGNFRIAHGKLTTNDLQASGHNLNVLMNLGLDLNTLELHGNIWPKVSSLPTIILAPLTFLSDFMVDIVIHGPIDKLDWHFALDRRLHNQEPSATHETPKNNPPPLTQP